MINKKGELTSTQLITIAILIISFAVILFFLVRANLKSDIDAEACRNSISMRGIPFGDYIITLKCKTQDVCFSMSGDCEEEVDDIIQVVDKDELVKEMVNLLADCWWMFGEGKIDYGKTGDCAICYKIYFDDEIKNNHEWVDISEHLLNKIPNSDEIYASYLYSRDNVQLIRGEKTLFTDSEYVVVTGIGDEKYIPPYFLEFSASELKDKMRCSKFITEA